MKNLIEEYDLMLAGTQYDNKYYNSEGSRKGNKFDLEIETDNPVDPLAISGLMIIVFIIIGWFLWKACQD